MTPFDHPDTPEHAGVFLAPATQDDATILQNLYELYAHDFSELVPLQIKPNGRFEVTPGDLWWSSETHWAFFIRTALELCGFALVRKGSSQRLSLTTDMVAAVTIVP